MSKRAHHHVCGVKGVKLFDAATEWRYYVLFSCFGYIRSCESQQSVSLSSLRNVREYAHNTLSSKHEGMNVLRGVIIEGCRFCVVLSKPDFRGPPYCVVRTLAQGYVGLTWRWYKLLVCRSQDKASCKESGKVLICVGQRGRS